MSERVSEPNRTAASGENAWVRLLNTQGLMVGNGVKEVSVNELAKDEDERVDFGDFCERKGIEVGEDGKIKGEEAEFVAREWNYAKMGQEMRDAGKMEGALTAAFLRKKGVKGDELRQMSSEERAKLFSEMDDEVEMFLGRFVEDTNMGMDVIREVVENQDAARDVAKYFYDEYVPDVMAGMARDVIKIHGVETEGGWDEMAEAFVPMGPGANYADVLDRRAEFIDDVALKTTRIDYGRDKGVVDRTKMFMMREVARTVAVNESGDQGEGAASGWSELSEMGKRGMGNVNSASEKAPGKKSQEEVADMEKRKEDFGKYLSVAKGKTREEFVKLSREEQLKIAKDFEQWRKLKEERTRSKALLVDTPNNWDYQKNHSKDAISRELDFKINKAKMAVNQIENALDRLDRVVVENEGQEGMVAAERARLEGELKKAQAAYEREAGNRGKGLSREQKQNIAAEEENLEKFKEHERLDKAERGMWEAGTESGRVRYSVEQKRVMDESAKLSKLRQEYKAIPAWKFGARRAMKEKIEKQDKLLSMAVDLLTEAQKNRNQTAREQAEGIKREQAERQVRAAGNVGVQERPKAEEGNGGAKGESKSETQSERQSETQSETQSGRTARFRIFRRGNGGGANSGEYRPKHMGAGEETDGSNRKAKHMRDDGEMKKAA